LLSGVSTEEVNPAYTSVIGRVKYARPLGVSVHQAAALAIARRGMGFREAAPARSYRMARVTSMELMSIEFERHDQGHRRLGPHLGGLRWHVDDAGRRDRGRRRRCLHAAHRGRDDARGGAGLRYLN
jgi:hypothetical protein